MKTFFPPKEKIERKWYLVDARGKVLGRLCSFIARILEGKHKSIYSPHLDTGDYVVVINAREVVLTGKKEREKKYYHHSGYVGGLKVRTAEEIRKRHPEQLIIHAVRGMLPKNSLGRKMLKKLKVYPGPEHPHQAQKPEVLEVKGA